MLSSISISQWYEWVAFLHLEQEPAEKEEPTVKSIDIEQERAIASHLAILEKHG